MTNEEKAIKYTDQCKEIIAFALIAICFSIPFLKLIKPIASFIILNEYNFLKIAGIIGIFILAIFLYVNYEKSKDKKQYCIEMLPVFMFFLYMCWTFISTLFSYDTYTAFWGTDIRKDGYLSYVAYAGIFSLAFYLNSKKYRRILLNEFVVTATLVIILLEIANHGFGGDIIWLREMSLGPFRNQNHFGYYLLIATSIANFLFVTEKDKIIKIDYAVLYIFLLVYLIQNNTFGCYLALLATLIVFLITACIKKDKIKPAIFSLVVLILLSCVINKDGEGIIKSNTAVLFKDISKIATSADKPDNGWEYAGSSRMKLWKYGIIFFFERPILGYGPDNLGEKYAMYNIKNDRPHNLIIQLLTTSGLPGFMLYMSAVRNHIDKKY